MISLRPLFTTDALTSTGSSSSHRCLLGTATLVLFLLGGTFLWRGAAGGSPSAEPRLMLAILPFKQIGPADGIDFFSEYLTEDPITAAANVNEAVVGILAEDSEDLEAFEERAGEPDLSFADVLKEMRQSGEL